MAGRRGFWMIIHQRRDSVAIRLGTTMARGRTKRRIAWIPIAAALFAMAVFAAAVPLHHTHMLSSIVTQPATSSEQPSVHQEHGHGHDEHAHGDHHLAQSGESGGAGTGHDDHDMSRCPVCSLAQVAKAPIAPAEPFIVALVRKHHEERPHVATLVVPASFHFRPVQPRAPPTAG